MCTTQRLPQRNQVTTHERGLLQPAHRQCLRCDSPAKDLRTAIENDLALANGRLVAPLYVKNLPGAKKRKTAKPARIAVQQSLKQEPEALIAALSLGALFAIILTSLAMKLFIG